MGSKTWQDRKGTQPFQARPQWDCRRAAARHDPRPSPATMKPKVVVVGSFVQDLTWRCAQFPRAGETVIGTFVTGPGGKGSNQAVASGRAGAPTMFIGAVGADVFAEGARKFYASEGIGARFAVKPGHATGTAAIIVNEAAENEIIVALGASEHLGPADIDPALVRGASILICQHEASLAINAHAFRMARRAGVATVLNPAPMRGDFDASILKLTDVLIPNETEFVALVNMLPACAAQRRGKSRARSLDGAGLNAMGPGELHRLCRAVGVPAMIVTLGRRGCFVSLADGTHEHIPGHAGMKVVDTTGAGDAFVGGFAAGFVRFKADMVAAARHGNAVAALSVTKFGTAPSMPRAPEIARFLRRRAAGNR
jgi:ribokinase